MLKLLRGTIVLSVVASTALMTGCVVRGEMAGGAYVEDDAPDLVYVSPGVYVVSDYDQPVFYDEGFYWLYRDGFWYRSRVHTGGWARVGYVPAGVRGIHRPRAYVHYRARGPVYRPGRGGVVRVRDHRTGRPVYGRPAERDHRVGRPVYGRPTEVRDHRRGPPPREVQVRDHRRGPPPRVETRDHRTPAPANHKKKKKYERRH